MPNSPASAFLEADRRYPGPRPFTYSDRHIFRGRDIEIVELLERLRQYNHLMLYARSGIGKSSLIEAGLLPKILETKEFQPHKIIFGAYNKKQPISPLDATILLLQKIDPNLNYLDKLIFKENSLWYFLKALQARSYTGTKKNGEAYPDIKPTLLIFDQFEELFTFPAEDITAFKQALAEALFTQIPDAFRAVLKNNPDAVSNEELSLLHEPLNLRILFSIRSDRISLLNRLTDCLPEILKNFYEIKPLSRQQSTAAIIEPAAMLGTFASMAFTYDLKLLTEILDYLASDQEQYIESFQVQIICKYIEDIVIDQKKMVITKTEIPFLENVFFNFYEKAVEKVPDIAFYKNNEKPEPNIEKIEVIRNATRAMLEKGMIFRTGNDTGIRLNLYRGQILEHFSDVDDASLWTLGKERIIRETPDAAGRMRYEISHDTLIKPILRALDMREKEIKEKADREELLRLSREQEKRRSRELGISGNTDIEWDYLLQGIQNKKAVLILGENAIRDEEGIPLYKRFVEGLDVREQRFTYYEEEQLFGFYDQFSSSRIMREMDRFYKSKKYNNILLEKIAEVPFSLILSFDPSNLLENYLNRNSTDYYFGYYDFKNSQKTDFDNALSNLEKRRVVYNLYGSIDDRSSLVFTLEDVYQHLYAILGHRELPAFVRYLLSEGEVFIFIGVNFRRITNGAILWQILERNNRSLRIALSDQPDLGKEELQAQSLLKIEFKQRSSDDFFNELYNRLIERNIEFNKDNEYASLERVLINKMEIWKMLESDELDKAIQQLIGYARARGKTDVLFDQIMGLSSKLRSYENDYQANRITVTEAQRVKLKITHEVKQIIDSFT